MKVQWLTMISVMYTYMKINHMLPLSHDMVSKNWRCEGDEYGGAFKVTVERDLLHYPSHKKGKDHERVLASSEPPSFGVGVSSSSAFSSVPFVLSPYLVVLFSYSPMLTYLSAGNSRNLGDFTFNPIFF